MPKLTKKMPKLSRRKDGTFYTRVAGKQINLRKDPQEARRQYNQIIAEIAANRVAIRGPQRYGIPISTLCVAFLQAHEQSRDYNNYRRCIRNLVALYGGNNTRDFGPIALKAVRESFATDGNQRKSDPISRQYANKLTNMIKTIFSWGVANEMAPPEVLVGLRAVRAIRAGESPKVKEAPPRTDVSESTIHTILPYLPKMVATMVQVQYLTGMRPTELCTLRLSELDRTREPWIYAPQSHKNAWRGKKRVVPIGPQARKLLTPLLETMEFDQEFVFSPIRSEADRLTAKRANRRTPVQPSQVDRSRGTRKIGDHYLTTSYGHAIRRACEAAERDGKTVERFSPNQLRHTAATRIRATYGLDAAQVILGHEYASTTEHYAHVDTSKAENLAERFG